MTETKSPTMAMTLYRLKVTMTEPLLGTQPNKNVATEYITSKAADPVTGELPEDELETLPVALEKGTTGFHRLDGDPIYYDYQVKGLFKEVGGTFNGLRGVKNLKSKITNFLFVTPRQIPLHVPGGWKPSAETLAAHPDSKVDFFERPLRAMTMQGPRTSLARSEMLPAGTWFECTIKVFETSPISENILRDILGYGELSGFGQFRNGGWGRFAYELAKVE